MTGLAVSPQYAREAAEGRLERAVTANCTLGLNGRLSDCAIVRSVPELDGAVLAALSEAEYAPTRDSARAVQLQYVFNFRLE